MQQWEQRTCLRNLRLADRFLNLELNIVFHLRFDSGEAWFLCFEHIGAREPISRKRDMRRNAKKGTVFIDVVKLMDSPERIIPAFVWFEPINRSNRLREHSLYFGSLLGFVFLASLRDWKSNSSNLLRRERRSGRPVCNSNSHKLLCEVIESGPEIVNNVPATMINPQRKRGLSRSYWNAGELSDGEGHQYLGSEVRLVV